MGPSRGQDGSNTYTTYQAVPTKAWQPLLRGNALICSVCQLHWCCLPSAADFTQHEHRLGKREHQAHGSLGDWP